MHPDEEAIIKEPRVFLPEEDGLRSCINQFKAILNSDTDTLFFFVGYNYIYDYFDPKGYYVYGWTNKGDTLMLGTASYIGKRRKELPNAPIMEYVSKWDENILSTYYWTYGMAYMQWTDSPGYRNVVFRIIFNRLNTYVQGIEVDNWYMTPQTIERLYFPEYIPEDYIKMKTD